MEPTAASEPEAAPAGVDLEEFLPLVRHVVFQVAARFPRHVEREELVRAGTLGLVEAARRFDPARGVPFGRFAARRIRGAVLDAVRAADWAPRSVRDAARKFEAAEQELAAVLGRAPSKDEVAVAVGVSSEDVGSVQDRVHRSVVLALDHRVASGDEDLSLLDVLTDRTSVEPEEQLEQRELHSYVRDAVALLPDRHRRVVAGYFFEGRSSDELAAELGVTPSRISQLRTEAMEILRHGIDAQYGTEADEASNRGHRATARKAAYAAAIARRSDWRDRLAAVSG